MAEKTTFIKLDRNIIRWQYYKDPIVMRVFLHLLLTAAGHSLSSTASFTPSS